jgi:hypothetical protein
VSGLWLSDEIGRLGDMKKEESPVLTEGMCDNSSR